MRKYDQAAVERQLIAEGQQTQNAVNAFYVETTTAERKRIFDLGYEQALRDYAAGPYAPVVTL